MKGILTLIAGLLVVTAYVAGYWPQHRRLVVANGEMQLLKEQLTVAEAHVRICKLQNRLHYLIEKVSQRNYGEAQTVSTQFFDQVRLEMPRNAQPQLRAALESALQKRDPVTAGLTKGDPATLELLQQMLREFRQAVAPEAAANPEPAATPTPEPSPTAAPPPDPKPAPAPGLQPQATPAP